MGYIEEAKDRAKRRKSAWNLLLLPAILLPLVATWSLIVLGLESIHTANYPGESLKNGAGVGVVLTAVSPLFSAIPVGMLIGNYLVWLVPSARRTLDVEAKSVRGSEFFRTQSVLLKFSMYVGPASVGLALVGALLPWQ